MNSERKLKLTVENTIFRGYVVVALVTIVLALIDAPVKREALLVTVLYLLFWVSGLLTDFACYCCRLLRFHLNKTE